MDELRLWLGYRNACYFSMEKFNAAVDRALSS